MRVRPLPMRGKDEEIEDLCAERHAPGGYRHRTAYCPDIARNCLEIAGHPLRSSAIQYQLFGLRLNPFRHLFRSVNGVHPTIRPRIPTPSETFSAHTLD
jgi:hypothetical protein